MWYKLHEGLEEEAQAKMTKEIEILGARVVHPMLELIYKAPEPVSTKTVQPQVKERKPPPGWLSEDEAYRNAMALMNGTRNPRRKR